MQVFTYYILALLGPIVGAEDDDDIDPVFVIDPSDPQKNEKLHKLVVEQFAPPARELLSVYYDEIKLALAYLLTFQRDKAEGYWNGVLPTSDITDPPPLFFEWLWEELFGDEDYHLPEGDYEIIREMPSWEKWNSRNSPDTQ